MAKYVTKDSLAQKLAQDTTLRKKEAIKIIDIIFNEMSDALAEEGLVDITGFGKF
ncbi:HU family DNA-binding protein, partial [Dubosiella newyorkensis]